MKNYLPIVVAFTIATLLSSCASQNHLELVGHYKHKSEDLKTVAAKSYENQEVISEMKSSDHALVATTSDATPDLKQLDVQNHFQNAFREMSEKKQVHIQKALSRTEKKLEKNYPEIQTQIQKYNELQNMNEKESAGAVSKVLLIILCFLLPPLAVGLAKGIGWPFWLSLILTLCFWIPGVIYALIVIIGD